MDHRDYYKILDLEPTATVKQIKDAYRKLAYRHHPDRNLDDPESGENMKRVNEAYAVLSNPEKRRRYDALQQQYGASAHTHFRSAYSEQDIFKGSDIHQVFEEMARSFGFRGVDDIFREFYGPGYRRFEFSRNGFHTRGFVFTGSRGHPQRRNAKLRGQGLLGKLAERILTNVSGIDLAGNRSDIHDRIVIAPGLARSGGPYAYYLREKSKKLVVKIPPGVRNGQRIRLGGMGRGGPNGKPGGDLYLEVRIREPRLKALKDKISDLLRLPGKSG